MDILATIIISAMLVEAVTNACKPLWDARKNAISGGAAVSLAIGLALALAADLDIAGALGVRIAWPLVPQIITGVIISRGSNYVHDIIGNIRRADV